MTRCTTSGISGAETDQETSANSKQQSSQCKQTVHRKQRLRYGCCCRGNSESCEVLLQVGVYYNIFIWREDGACKYTTKYQPASEDQIPLLISPVIREVSKPPGRNNSSTYMSEGR